MGWEGDRLLTSTQAWSSMAGTSAASAVKERPPSSPAGKPTQFSTTDMSSFMALRGGGAEGGAAGVDGGRWRGGGRR